MECLKCKREIYSDEIKVISITDTNITADQVCPDCKGNNIIIYGNPCVVDVLEGD